MYEMFVQEFDEWRYFEGLWDDGRDPDHQKERFLRHFHLGMTLQNGWAQTIVGRIGNEALKDECRGPEFRQDRPMNWEHQGWNGLDCEAGLDAKNLCWEVDAMSRRGRQRQGVALLHSEPVGVDRPLAKENQEAEAEA